MELVKWQKVSLFNILYRIIHEICEDGVKLGTYRKIISMKTPIFF